MADNVSRHSPATPAPPFPNPSSGSGPSPPPRRSSYASVVAGSGGASTVPTAPAGGTQSSSSRSSGSLSHFIGQAPPPPPLPPPSLPPLASTHSLLPQPLQPAAHHARSAAARGSLENHAASAAAENGGAAGRTGGAARPANDALPGSLLLKMMSIGSLYMGASGSGPDALLTPSYLRGSRYMERLAEAYEARLSVQRDAPTAHAPAGAAGAGGSGASGAGAGAGSLSTSSSSANLHKLALSHRGMTYDIIEKEPPAEIGGLGALPTRWNDADKWQGMELRCDGLAVRYAGPGRSHEQPITAAAVRADHPISPQCGIYYYELLVVAHKKEGTIGIGFSGPRVVLNRLPGWEPDSWAYHGDDGRSFCCSSQGRDYGPKFSSGDFVGCGLNFRTGCVFFTLNGVFLGNAFRDVKGKLYPSIGMKGPGEEIKANFGQTPFVFDIDGMMAEEKALLENEIQKASVAQLRPPLDESALVRSLVAEYLAHEGYIASASAFAEEMQEEAGILQSQSEAMPPQFDINDVHSLNRQRIRMAILEGDIDKAFKEMWTQYPRVFQNNEQIYFRLRCRKFIEMIRRCSELDLMAQRDGESETAAAKATNGHDRKSYADDGVLDAEAHDDGQDGEDDGEQEESDADVEDGGGGGGGGGSSINQAAVDADGDEDDNDDDNDDNDESSIDERDGEHVDEEEDADQSYEDGDEGEDAEEEGDDDEEETEGEEEEDADDTANEMELDEPAGRSTASGAGGGGGSGGGGGGGAWDGMDTEAKKAPKTTTASTTKTSTASAADQARLNLTRETIKYGQELQSEWRDDGRREIKKALEETFSLMAYEDPKRSVVAHLLEPSGRVPVAEDLNSAILVELGYSPTSALERLCQQTEVLVNDISEEGSAGALINVRKDYMQ